MKRLVVLFFVVAMLVVVTQPPGARANCVKVATHQDISWCLSNDNALVANHNMEGSEPMMFTMMLNHRGGEIAPIVNNVNLSNGTCVTKTNGTMRLHNFNFLAENTSPPTIKGDKQNASGGANYNIIKPIYVNCSIEKENAKGNKNSAIYSVSDKKSSNASRNNQNIALNLTPVAIVRMQNL